MTAWMLLAFLLIAGLLFLFRGDVQVLSTVPVMFCYWAKPEHGHDLARILNDHIAEVVRRHPQRFRRVGDVRLPAGGRQRPPRRQRLPRPESRRAAHDRVLVRLVEVAPLGQPGAGRAAGLGRPRR